MAAASTTSATSADDVEKKSNNELLKAYNTLAAQNIHIKSQVTKLGSHYDNLLGSQVQAGQLEVLDNLVNSFKDNKEALNAIETLKADITNGKTGKIVSDVAGKVSAILNDNESKNDASDSKDSDETDSKADRASLLTALRAKGDENFNLITRVKELVSNKSDLEKQLNTALLDKDNFERQFNDVKNTYDQFKDDITGKYNGLNDLYNAATLKVDQMKGKYETVLRNEIQSVGAKLNSQQLSVIENLATAAAASGDGIDGFVASIKSEFGKLGKDAVEKTVDHYSNEIESLAQDIASSFDLQNDNSLLKNEISGLKVDLQKKISENIESVKKLSDVKGAYDKTVRDITNEFENFKVASVNNAKTMLNTKIHQVSNAMIAKIEEKTGIPKDTLESVKDDITTIANKHGLEVDKIVDLVDKNDDGYITLKEIAQGVRGLKDVDWDDAVHQARVALAGMGGDLKDQLAEKAKEEFSLQANLKYVIKYLPNIATVIAMYQSLLALMAVAFFNDKNQCNGRVLAIRITVLVGITVFYILLEIISTTHDNYMELTQITKHLNTIINTWAPDADAGQNPSLLEPFLKLPDKTTNASGQGSLASEDGVKLASSIAVADDDSKEAAAGNDGKGKKKHPKTTVKITDTVKDGIALIKAINPESSYSLLKGSCKLMKTGNILRVVLSTIMWLCVCQAIIPSILIECLYDLIMSGSADSRNPDPDGVEAETNATLVASIILIGFGVCLRVFARGRWENVYRADISVDGHLVPRTDAAAAGGAGGASGAGGAGGAGAGGSGRGKSPSVEMAGITVA